LDFIIRIYHDERSSACQKKSVDTNIEISGITFRFLTSLKASLSLWRDAQFPIFNNTGPVRGQNISSVGRWFYSGWTARLALSGSLDRLVQYVSCYGSDTMLKTWSQFEDRNWAYGGAENRPV